MVSCGAVNEKPMTNNNDRLTTEHHPANDTGFWATVTLSGGGYIFAIVMLVIAVSGYLVGYEYAALQAAWSGQFSDPALWQGEGQPTAWDIWLVESPVGAALAQPEVRYSIWFSLLSCTIAAVCALWVAVPIGYLMSRCHFRGKAVIDAILDIPIVLPPLVVGICLLMLFNLYPFKWAEHVFVFNRPGVILAQFMVAAAFAVRTMRVTFDQISTRFEDVATTLGASRGQAFSMIILPQAARGILAAGTLAWARSLGEFGPILVFAGSTRMRTEVLPTTVFLELQSGNTRGMIAVSMLMIVIAMAVLLLTRALGLKKYYV